MGATVSRASLPTEFYDRTSALVARAPLPQFTFAEMVYAAVMRAELMRVGPDAFRLMQGRGVSDQGAPYPDLETMQLILSEKLPGAQAILVADELADGPGHTIRINRPVFSGGGYSFASRRLGAGGTISTTPITVQDEQVAITIQTSTGPMSASGTVTQPYAINRRDSQRSVHSLVDRVAQALKYDRNKMLDTAVAALFDSPSSVIYPGDPSGSLDSSGTTGDAAALPVPGDRPFSLEVLMRAIKVLQVANIPHFTDGVYRAVITPTQAMQLALDPLWRQQAKELPERNILRASAVGRIPGVEVYASNSISVDTSTVSGNSINHGVVFGPGMVGYVAGRDGCFVANSTNDNYGNDTLVIWQCDEGAAVVDNRFGVGIHSD